MTEDKHPASPAAGTAEEAASTIARTTPTPRIQDLDDDETQRSAQSLNIRADLFDEDEYSIDEYEELLGMYEESIQDIQEGQIVTGHILRVDENVVVLDVGFKSEGAVPLDEFKPSDSLEVGAEV